MKTEFYNAQRKTKIPFLQFPKALITEPQFKGLSLGAKLLYAIMLDRAALSAANGFTDEQGRVYIHCPTEEAAVILNCTKDTVTKIMKELEGVNGDGLIKRVKRGVGKSLVIYVKELIMDEKSVLPDFVVNPKNSDCESENLCLINRKNRTCESEKLGLNNNKYNNNKNNNNLINNMHTGTEFKLTKADCDAWLEQCEKKLGLGQRLA